MHVGELRPRDRHHLDGGVELHRARTEWDHRPVEREVLVGQTAQVAQHLVLGVVAGEHRLGQELVGAPQRLRYPGRGVRQSTSAPACSGAEHAEQRVDEVDRRGLVEAEPIVVVVDEAQIEAGAAARRAPRRQPPAHDLNGVEPRVVDQLEPSAARTPAASDRGQPVHPLGDAAQARRGRAMWRTGRRCWPAAPGRCRCSTSPSPGGCAARGSAARAAAPADPRCRC